MPYIYLLRTRASININESVYKIGKTSDFNKRLSGYDKGSEPVLILFVNDCDIFERILIEMFNTCFIKRNDYGNEYFEGNVSQMIQMIMVKFNELNMCYSISKQSEQEQLIQSQLDYQTKQELLCKMTNLFQKLFNKINVKNINKFSLDLNRVMGNSTSNDCRMIHSNMSNEISRYNAQLININRNPNIPCYKKFGEYLQNNSNLIFELSNYHVNSNDIEAKRIYQILKNII